MTEKKDDGLFSCTNMCWLIGALVGFALWLVLMRNAGMNFIFALIIGAIVAFGIGWVLKNFFCTDIKVDTAPVAATAAVATAGAAVASAAAAPSEPVADEAPVANTIVEEAAEEVVATADDVADLEALDAPLEADVAAPVEAPTAPVEELVAAKPKKAAKAPAAKKKAPAKAKPAAAPEAATGDTAEKKPRTMKAPRKAGADDLKLIKGVGPKLEGTLNDLGFYHFDQISKWGDAEIAWVDNRLKFKGRITRDGWIEQAGILADGGETEFSKRGKKA